MHKKARHIWDDQGLKRTLHLLVWFLLGLTYLVILQIIFPWEVALGRTLINLLGLGLAFYGNLFLVERYLEPNKTRIYLMGVILLLVVSVYIRAALGNLLPEVDLASLDVSTYKGTYLGAFITTVLALLIGLMYQMLEIRYRNEKRNLATINQQQEAQLEALRAQINPHFLFNTLNNIYSLAVTGSEQTADMVLRLSGLLRYVVYETRNDSVPLVGEIEQIRQYLDLFQLQQEERVDIRFEQQGDPATIKIEPMLLLPLVENSCKHCDYNTNPNAFMRFELTIASNELHFVTQNTRDPRDQQKDRTGGVGLDNIKKRLGLKYPGQHNFSAEQSEKQFRTVLKIQF